MYLGMTDNEYETVLNSTPQLVAKRLHIPDVEIQDNSILTSLIEQKDKAAFLIMQEFLNTYTHWWESSKKLSDQDTPENYEVLKRLISSRDEIRNALISYLNAKYGKPNERH